MDDDASPIDRRTVLGAAGAALGATVGLAGITTADHVPGCVATTAEAKAATECPVVSHETYLEEGRTGFTGATCEVDGVTWVNVTFDCTESWYVKKSSLVEATDCTC